MNFIDQINFYNQEVTKHEYYDHNINISYPFAEFIIVRLHDTSTVVQAFLNKFITKDVETDVSYTLDNALFMSKYLSHYSTYDSDYTSLYLKLLFNDIDIETINKENLVLSQTLYPMIKCDSTLLYFEIYLDSTTADITNQYTFFGLSQNDLLCLNNKHFCRVKNVFDSTAHVGGDYTVDSTYQIEFLELDTTSDLIEYMNGQWV
jgi:hypothetical protein